MYEILRSRTLTITMVMITRLHRGGSLFRRAWRSHEKTCRNRAVLGISSMDAVSDLTRTLTGKRIHHFAANPRVAVGSTNS